MRKKLNVRRKTSRDRLRNPKRTVAEVMTREPLTLKLSDTLRLADDLMTLAHLRHFPVTDNGKIAGIVDQADLLQASMLSLIKHPDKSLRSTLGTIAVKDFVKPAVRVPLTRTVQAAARTMVEKKAECLLVTKNRKLVGVVSRTDLLSAMAQASPAL